VCEVARAEGDELPVNAVYRDSMISVNETALLIFPSQNFDIVSILEQQCPPVTSVCEFSIV